MVIKVLLDSNFLMIPAQFSVDIIEELERVLNGKVKGVVLTPVYEELQNIARRRETRKRKQAEIALKLVDKFDVVDVERQPDETVDELLLRLAAEWGCPVATNDRGLRKRLRDLNITTVYLRQKTRLEVRGVVR